MVIQMQIMLWIQKKQTPARDSHMMSSLCSHVCFLFLFSLRFISLCASRLSRYRKLLKETVELVIFPMTGYSKDLGQIHAENSKNGFCINDNSVI